MKATKPNTSISIAEIHQQLKGKYPRRYALEMVMRLRRRGIRASRQQVYQFFNGAGTAKRSYLLEAAQEILV